MPALTAEHVTAGYGRTPVIREVCLEAGGGEITAIVGPNGAGKSTFAKALCGVVKPTHGQVWVGTTDITKLPGHVIPRKGLTYVPQTDNVFPTLSVRENLEVASWCSKRRIGNRIDETLDILPDLRDAQRKKAAQLSGGQQNMLAIARALMTDPTVIVLDEPTAGLSPAYTDIVWSQIARIAASGTAAVVIEQNVDRALSHAQSVYVFVAGRNHVHGPATDIARLDLGGIFLGHEQSNAIVA